MIKQAKRLGRAVKRVGCTPYKVLYSIKLEDLRLFGVKDAAIISICFERGGKLASSTDYTVLVEDETRISNGLTLRMNDTLKLVATMYRDNKTGRFQDKRGKLLLRQEVTNKFGGKSYLGLGVVSLLLNDYIDVDGEYPKGITDKVFALPLNNNGTEVHITLNSLLFGEMDSPDIDDTMSVHSSISAQSDSSFMGASFYDGPGNASYYPGRSATHDTIHENPEGEDEDADPSKLNESANDATLTEAKIRELASRNSEKETVWGSPAAQKTPVSKSASATKNSSTNHLIEKLEVDQLKRLKSDRLSLSPARVDLEELRKQIIDLQAELAHRDGVITTLEREMATREINHRQQLASLKAELHEAKRASRIKSTLEIDVLLREYSAVTAELELIKEDLKSAKMAEASAISEKAEMERASRDASTAVTEARLRQAAVDEDNEDLIDELISTKINCANYASEFEEERRKNILNKRKLQKYAERVAALEVQAVTKASSTVNQSENIDLSNVRIEL